jgi:hypothetical protein
VGKDVVDKNNTGDHKNAGNERQQKVNQPGRLKPMEESDRCSTIST